MTDMLSRALLVGSLLCLTTQVVAAEDALLIQKALPLQAEQTAAMAAVQACAAKNFHVSVVIVDAYGNTKLLLVSDGALYTTADSARRKAYTAAMMRRTSVELQKQVAANPGAPMPGEGNPNFLFLAGGVPIRAGTEVIGGIGVGGAASEQDAECAQAGVDAIRAILK